nr:RNA-directed DNA polymerase, eukaryota [Tanacetum cinerariifolium]
MDLVMEMLGFGIIWRSWIKGCLLNAYAFVLAMEGLHAFICKAVDMGIYKGISIGNDNLRISHLIYVDDVICDVIGLLQTLIICFAFFGPYKMGTVREILAESTEGAPQFGPERSRVYSDLTPEEKDRYNANIRATNILLQGLPKDIYTLINHYTDAKDIWDNVKMLLEGSELTKEDQESQL